MFTSVAWNPPYYGHLGTIITSPRCFEDESTGKNAFGPKTVVESLMDTTLWPCGACIEYFMLQLHVALTNGDERIHTLYLSWTGNRAFWLVDFSYWPSDCLSRVIMYCNSYMYYLVAYWAVWNLQSFALISLLVQCAWFYGQVSFFNIPFTVNLMFNSFCDHCR